MMSPFQQSMLLAFIAGATIPLGGLISSIEKIKPQWLEEEFRHAVIAFGGGILLAGIALVLVPKGMEFLSLSQVVIGFAAGGLVFFFIDRWLQQKGGSASQLMAMLLDFVPEAIALGAMITKNIQTAWLLCLLIAFQNLPESFNAFREVQASSSFSKKKIIALFSILMLLGPLCAFLGLQFLAEAEVWLAFIMIFSSGGILYLIFQDISPQVRLEKHWAPPLGTVGGFLVGIIGHMLLEG